MKIAPEVGPSAMCVGFFAVIGRLTVRRENDEWECVSEEELQNSAEDL